MRFDLLRSPVVLERWEGLRTALDAREMLPRFRAAFAGGLRHGWTIERCALDEITWLPDGDHCNLTYDLRLAAGSGEPARSALAIARLFSGAAEAAAYRRDRLDPLAGRAAGREEIFPFESPVGVIDELSLAVSIFPVDAGLPTLLDALDPERMTRAFRELPGMPGGAVVESCEVVQVRRRNRCVVRYRVRDGSAAFLVYGKVHARGRGRLATDAVTALRAHLDRRPDAFRFHVPRSLGLLPELQLALLEAVPGRRRVARRIKRRLRGGRSASSGRGLEESIDACARIAAELHGSALPLGPPRTLAADLAGVREAVAGLRPTAPDLAELLSGFRDRIEADASAWPPLAPGLSHGDFKASQVLFDRAAAGLVDFDTICQAEPARDLGHFLAYLRVTIFKEEGAVSSPLARELGRVFLDGYVSGSRNGAADEERLRSRARVWEATALLHLAVKSWAKFKGDRLEHAIALLEGTGGD